MRPVPFQHVEPLVRSELRKILNRMPPEQRRDVRTREHSVTFSVRGFASEPGQARDDILAVVTFTVETGHRYLEQVLAATQVGLPVIAAKLRGELGDWEPALPGYRGEHSYLWRRLRVTCEP